MREELLNKWRSVCVDEEDIDSCDFFKLFHSYPDKLSREEVADIMQYFPHHEALVERIMEVFEAVSPTKDNTIPDNEMTKLAEQHVKEMIQLCKDQDVDDDENGDNYEKWKALTAVMMEDKKEFETLRWSLKGESVRFEENVSDAFYDIYTTEDSKHYCLSEALYGMCGDFSLRRYMMEPLMNRRVNFRPYLELSLAGGNYVVDDENILVCHSRP